MFLGKSSPEGAAAIAAAGVYETLLTERYRRCSRPVAGALYWDRGGSRERRRRGES